MLGICTSVPENFSETKILLDYSGQINWILAVILDFSD